jgi:putative ABC transport system permease protein
MKSQRASKPPRHPLNPRIMGIRASALIDHYRMRLRRQLLAELLAGAGIAVGVALVFGVLLANSSITGSAPALIRAVDGSARLQLRARSSEGFSEALAQRAGKVPGVQYAAFLLRENGELIGPRGRSQIQIVGLSASIVALHGAATRNLGAGAELLNGGIGLPAPLAKSVGARSGARVELLVGGEARTEPVAAVLDSATIGPVAQAPIAIAQLAVAQEVTEHAGRVTEVLIKPRPGADRRVAAELRALVADRISVEGADSELRLLEQTAKPLGQSTGLFAAIGGMVGLLFAANAMLLTLPERRRIVAELHAQGFEPRQIRLILLSQALLLGATASLVGLALGDLLAHTVFRQSPVYLAAAFPIASHQSVDLPTAALAFAGGVLAALLASLAPMLVLRSSSPLASAAQGAEQAVQRIGPRVARALGAIGALLLIGVTALVLADPGLTILGGILLALAVPCLIPALFAAALIALKRIGGRMRGSMLSLAAIELNATATRSVALIAVAGLAVYGSVAIQGARGDLSKGLDAAVVEYLDTAQVWVAANDKFLTVDSFKDAGATAAVARAPGVSAVRVYEGGLLDVGSRSLWIRARSPRDSRMIQASQLLQGNLGRASSLIRRGGWAAISNAFAAERRLHVGEDFTLPTPTGNARFGVAAITTNTGWSPGAVTLNLGDYRRWWGTSRPAALEVDFKPGVSPAAGRDSVRRALAGRPGLRVETQAERVASFQASAREGLRSLGQISTLLLISAALAVAAVLSASIWQRRARLASLSAQGFDHMQLWRTVVLESGVAVAIGCADGALLGLYGHALASRWLALSTGFPAPFSLGLGDILLAPAIVAGCTVLLAGALGFQSARVSPSLAFQDQP